MTTNIYSQNLTHGELYYKGEKIDLIPQSHPNIRQTYTTVKPKIWKKQNKKKKEGEGNNRGKR